MSEKIFKLKIDNYKDFPKKGIVFRDIFPLLREPDVFYELIQKMSSCKLIRESEALLAIDARGFIFGSAIAFNLKKPLVVARKPGKLPGDLISNSYDLEYGTNTLSIQKKALKGLETFHIVDDLLATGGTVQCVSDLLKGEGKKISGLSVVVELMDLNGGSKLNFPIDSQIKF